MVRLSKATITALCLIASVPLLVNCTPGTQKKMNNHGVVSQASTYQAVSELIADYGFAADQRDTAAVSALFTEDGKLAVPSAKAEVQGRDGITALFGQAWKPVAASGQQRRHIITGLRLFDETADSARFRAIMNVAGKPSDGSPQIYLTGYYLGEAVKTDDGWRLKQLTINVD